MQIDQKTVERIIDEFLFKNEDRYHSDEFSLSYEDKLQIILSESIQALAFVTALEDEFDVEFDDDEIDLDFFMQVSTIIERVQRHLEKA